MSTLQQDLKQVTKQGQEMREKEEVTLVPGLLTEGSWLFTKVTASLGMGVDGRTELISGHRALEVRCPGDIFRGKPQKSGDKYHDNSLQQRASHLVFEERRQVSPLEYYEASAGRC